MSTEKLFEIGHRLPTTEATFDTALLHIQNGERLTTQDAEALRPVLVDLLTVHGHLDEVVSSPECQKSLEEPKLERLNTGLGRAVVTALDGDKTFQQFRQIFIGSPDDNARSASLATYILDTKIGVFRAWASQQSSDHKRINGAGDYSRRRGLEHALGDVLCLASGKISPEEYAKKTNQRTGAEARPSTVSSIPHGSLPTFFEFLAELCETPIESLDLLKEKHGLTSKSVDIQVVMGLDSAKPVKKS